jgi:hypothetical protein
MTWKNRKPTPKTRLVWNWTEVWATIGVSGALAFVVVAALLAYSL